MTPLVAASISVPIGLLLACVLVPPRRANAAARLIRQGVTAAAGLQFALAAGLALVYAIGLIPMMHLSLVGADSPLALTLRYDGVASLMLTLVSFIGWVICRYSIRYLDGESRQGGYFRWTAFTIGSVSLMVVSGNLLLFVAAWMMTSFGLHHLLLHYRDRPAAKRAAWTKFTVSRIGDAALLVALVLVYSEYGTFDFAEIFTAIQWQIGSPSWNATLAGWCLVLGAVTKSAQIPFHTWLPLTMETPTPVSALMHAGIVNAGGYLIIRTSPLVSLNANAMTALAVIGGITACVAAVVMLTQSSIKKSLAYSTIAQMGFMMLQCGLGAFSAAMLHILAHSLYKAHAFLSSGSVLDQATDVAGANASAPRAQWPQLGLAVVAVGCLYLASLAIFGISPASKPGGVLLGFVLSLALSSWLARAFATSSRGIIAGSLGLAGILCLAYATCFFAVDSLVSPSLPEIAAPAAAWVVAAVVVTGFMAMLILQQLVLAETPPRWLRSVYVHAANGFYVDAWLRRSLATLASE